MAFSQNLLITIGADISDLAAKLATASTSVESFATSAQNVGQSFSDIGDAATKAFTPIYALGGLVGGLGLKRIMDGERVSNMFDVIYDSSTDAEKAMESVLGLVKGTRYGLNEIADPFAQLKSTGVDDATALNAMLANMELASMKGSPELIGQLTELQQAAMALGRFDGSMLNRFSAAFVDVPLIVGNALDMTRDEAREFLSTGAYDIEEMMNIVSDGILNGSEGIAGSTQAFSGMIEKEGETLAGKVANMFAAMARAGETIWQDSGAFDQLKQAITDITAAFDNSASAFVPAASAIGDALANLIGILMRMVDAFNGMPSSMQTLIANLIVMGAAFGPIMLAIGAFIKSFALLSPIFTIFRTALGLVGTALTKLGGFFALLLNPSQLLASIISHSGLAFNVLRAALVAVGGTIGIIIGVIAGLVAAFVYLWQTNDGFREAMISAWNAIVSAVSTALAAVIEFFQGWMAQISALWDQHGTSILEAATNIWNGIVTAITFILDTLIAALTPIFSIIADVVVIAWEFIKTATSAAWEFITTLITEATNIIMNIIAFFAALFTGDWAALWEATKAILESAWNIIQAAFKLVLDLIIAIVTTAWEIIKSVTISVWEMIKTAISNAWDAILTIVDWVIETVKSVVSSAWEWIKSTTSTVWNAIVSFITETFASIYATVSTKINEVKSTLETVWNTISSFFSTILATIIGVVSEKFEEMKTAVSEKIEDVKQFIEDGWNAAQEFLEGIDLGTIGRNIIEGLASGIKGAADLVKGAVDWIADKIPDWIKDPLGVHSPSRVMRDQVGKWIPIGLADGISGATSAVERSVNAMAAVVPREIDSPNVASVKVSRPNVAPADYSGDTTQLNGKNAVGSSNQGGGITLVYNGNGTREQADEFADWVSERIAQQNRLNGTFNGLRGEA